MKQKLPTRILLFFQIVTLFFLVSLFINQTPAYAATILLDPGHSSIISGTCDPNQSKGVYDDPYGIYDDDYPNCPEITEVMNIATWLNQKLTADGYQVIMTKQAWDSPTFVSLWDRAQQANSSNVDLAVSIHDDHGQSWSSFAQVYVQDPSYYRVNNKGNRVTFSQVAGLYASSIANKSKQYGNIMASERTKVEGHTVSVAVENFAGRAPLAAGNIPQVQLYAKVPWVYNEVGGNGIDINKYEQGILNGIEKAVPPSGGLGGNAGDTSITSNCVITQIGNAPPNPALPPGCANGAVSAVVQKVIQLGQAHLKTGTYVWGAPPRNWASENPATGNAPTSFDCSGFAGWAWYWGSGGTISMQGQTNTDWDNFGNNPHYERVVTNDETSFQPGDLIYFNFGSPTPPDHVGIYIGHDTSKYSCGTDDCFMQYYQTGLPGNEVSLKPELQYVMGYIRIKNP